MPINYALYPPDWKAISTRIRERAGNHCEWCGVPNGEWGARDCYGRWHERSDIVYMNGSEGDLLFDGKEPKYIKIVLTVAHIDHNIANNDPVNLAALCQRCHLRHDAKEHARHAKETLWEKINGKNTRGIATHGYGSLSSNGWRYSNEDYQS